MELQKVEIEELIVDKAIDMLMADGLKFSVDKLATVLKISKKTIYKYFDSKEVLATAIYETVFDGIDLSVIKILSLKSGKRQIYNIFELLQTALFFNDDGMFNRFSLNDKIKEYANMRLVVLWGKIEKLLILLGFEKLLLHLSFKSTVFATLKSFMQQENSSTLIKDFIELILGEGND